MKYVGGKSCWSFGKILFSRDFKMVNLCDPYVCLSILACKQAYQCENFASHWIIRMAWFLIFERITGGLVILPSVYKPLTRRRRIDWRSFADSTHAYVAQICSGSSAGGQAGRISLDAAIAKTDGARVVADTGPARRGILTTYQICRAGQSAEGTTQLRARLVVPLPFKEKWSGIFWIIWF